MTVNAEFIIHEVEFTTAKTDFGPVLHGCITVDGKDYAAIRPLKSGVGALGMASSDVVKALMAQIMQETAKEVSNGCA